MSKKNVKLVDKKKIVVDSSDDEDDIVSDLSVDDSDGELGSGSGSESEEIEIGDNLKGGNSEDEESEMSDSSIDSDDDTCPSKYVDAPDDEEFDDEIDSKYNEDTLQETVNDVKILAADKRFTKPFMTKYERVRLIGDRTRQLASGAKPMMKNIEGLSSMEIAKLELENNIIPLVIERPLPNGMKEIWYTRELIH
jgi:DNA-directed RNA polymerase subunit K/omega